MQALAARMGPEIAGSPSKLATGESFPSEWGFARRLLEENENVDAPAFVDCAYRSILGRNADFSGQAFFVGKLRRKELNRPHFLRELFWSDELRQPR